MASRAIEVELTDEVDAAIRLTAEHSGREYAAVAGELLTEAVRMRRVPGIVFADGVSGRVARVAGTGLEVWEIIQGYQASGEEWQCLREAYDWLSEAQLRAALAYYEAFPAEIEERLQREARWTPEHLYATYPFMRPSAD